MPTVPITFIKGDKVGSETDYRDALPVNMYGVIKPLFGADGYMSQYPGLTQLASTSGASRGGVWNPRFRKHFRVQGNDFVEIDSSGSVTVLGVVPGNDTVSLPYSFNTQAIIANGRYFLYDATNGFREVTDSDVGDPIDGVWVDGYYFFCDKQNLFHTNISDESQVDPLAFATSEFSPDPTLAVAKTQDNKVAVFNRYTTEFFQNVATDNFAFQRLVQRAINSGIVGTHAKAVYGAQFFILGGNKEESPSAYIMTVGGVQKIATREVDKIINTYTEDELSTVVVEAYSEDATTFVKYHLPNETLLFNETLAKRVGYEQAWSILGTNREENYRGIHLIPEASLGKWVCGDKRSGNVGILDETVTTQYGDMAEWFLFTPFSYIETGSIDEMEVETIPGFTGSNDASVFVSLTQNGFTYGEQWVQLYGKSYQYSNRFIVCRLGYIRDWVGFRLRGLSRSKMAFARGFIKVG